MNLNSSWIMIFATIIGAVIIGGGLIALVAKFYRKVEQGKALIVNAVSTVHVSFTGKTVLPIFHKAEVMDISLKTIVIDRRGKDGLICKDNIRADIKVDFYVRVNKDERDVLKVAHTIGCARASDQTTLEELFNAKFSEALKTVGKQLEFVELYEQRDEFRDKIIQVIGTDLNGYVLDAAAIDFLEQTPLSSLDPNNILDAEGIRKITELNAGKHVETNKWQQEERMQITKKNVEAQEAVLELERQQADAEAKQAREIATMRAREAAETAKVEAEERLRSESARIKSDEALAIATENKTREIQVAQKNRERTVAIETEKVERAKSLEAIAREREVELERISKEKALEIERKAIADVVRERIAVDKTVAEEEEHIKDLRMQREAERLKKVKITEAEASAEEKLVQSIKAAEAAETAAKFRAKERLTLAEAELEASDKEAKAKIRMAEGTQAETAAHGLAQVKVKEADALAVEKQGLAEAKVLFEKMHAQAQGEEQKGMVAVRVKEADASATEKQGLVEARVEREKLQATAIGQEDQGMARARVEEAMAQVIAKKGVAEATAVRERMTAEAGGLTEKFAAMKTMEGAAREHEEFRLQLDNVRTLELERIGAKKQVAEAQAEILGEAFKSAKIDIVGGDGAFFDRFVNAVSVSKSMDGFVRSGDVASTFLKDYLSGEASLSQDIKQVLTRPALGSGEIQQLTLSAFLAHLMGQGGDEGQRSRLQQVLEMAKKLGVDSAAR